MSSTIIRTDQLCYNYTKGVSTLTDIHLQVNRGDIYGFLGPNGSGKTTTLSLLLGLLKTQHGTIEILGKDLQHHRKEVLRKVGSLIESPSLYNHLTAKENLEVYREIYGASKARLQGVLNIVGLSDTGKKTVRQFSLGMRQRLSIALALLPKPELLILDEPTNGLDPAGILELRSLIRSLNKEEGITFLISSHILSEVEKMVNRIGIIYKGRMRFQGSLGELHKLQQQQSLVQLDTSDNLRAWAVLKKFQAELQDEDLVVPYTDLAQVAIINRMLIDNDLDVYNLHPRKQTLETIFINLTTE
ncbi:ATP-binding cassette domain-containing protein [Chryseosolibacter indicus]|uniref:ATP-binding cassette domain-containing protein n=1 Tax=Chryseosolibacter indicus TaxID=2782351 RepID=A0ABS5VXH5_9BACT|nr:ATP-binding cassette domain-containing protein [Chryseosolibacter indicus]MBT1705758.1 ATP-binding cassette domain-containing protein [Chryseosolibacter indicus]